MKVSIDWLKQLVEIKNIKEVIRLLPLRTVALKEVTDDYIELDMKGYNRADLLSMRGVAREVAAITDSKAIFPQDEVLSLKMDLPKVNVQVEDVDLSPVYIVAKIENLKVEQSDETWVKKLSDSGIRSINNIADVTNLMMLEYGQPMHAFDASEIEGETIIVRRAKKEEKLITLDNKIRDLDETDLLIADPKKPLGLAGVMGGKYSEISSSTYSILLEAAIFDPISIRKTVQRHNLPSEAAKRFQHGLFKKNLLLALKQAISMYENLGGKLTAISVVGDLEDPFVNVNLNRTKLDSLIGIEIPREEVEAIFDKLHFSWNRDDGSGNSWQVTPYNRLDINTEVDLVEEVARMHGYEKIPAKPLLGESPKKIDQTLPNFIYKLKKSLADVGLTEVQTYSFFSTNVLKALRFNKSNKDKAIRIANPISSETEYMRTYIWPNLIEVVSRNLRNGFKDIAIFEIGKIYQPGPKESYRLAIALMNGSDNPIKELISIFQNLRLHPKGVNVKPGKMMKELETLFHPNRYANVEASGKVIGGLAEVHPRFLNNFGIEKRVAILEISLESLINAKS